MSLRILHMTDIEGARMTFAADDSTNTTQIPPASNHAQITCKRETALIIINIHNEKKIYIYFSSIIYLYYLNLRVLHTFQYILLSYL